MDATRETILNWISWIIVSIIVLVEGWMQPKGDSKLEAIRALEGFNHCFGRRVDATEVEQRLRNFVEESFNHCFGRRVDATASKNKYFYQLCFLIDSSR